MGSIHYMTKNEAETQARLIQGLKAINADLLAALEQAGLELGEAGKLIKASTIGGQNMAGTGDLFSKASDKALAIAAKAKE